MRMRIHPVAAMSLIAASLAAPLAQAQDSLESFSQVTTPLKGSKLTSFNPIVTGEAMPENLRDVTCEALLTKDGQPMEHGLTWRPHVKTHKSAQVAARQLAAGARGLSCATPREAEVMATVCDDLLLAYPPVGTDRLRRTSALAERVRLGVMLDSLESASGLSEAVGRVGASVRVLVEMDAGMQRTGVTGVDAAIALARDVDALPGIAFDGFGFLFCRYGLTTGSWLCASCD